MRCCVWPPPHTRQLCCSAPPPALDCSEPSAPWASCLHSAIRSSCCACSTPITARMRALTLPPTKGNPASNASSSAGSVAPHPAVEAAAWDWLRDPPPALLNRRVPWLVLLLLAWPPRASGCPRGGGGVHSTPGFACGWLLKGAAEEGVDAVAPLLGLDAASRPAASCEPGCRQMSQRHRRVRMRQQRTGPHCHCARSGYAH